MRSEEEKISENLMALLRSNLRPGDEAQIAVNKDLRQVLVFVDGRLILTCSFDDLLAGPGFHSN
jgi:hypothetical protein